MCWTIETPSVWWIGSKGATIRNRPTASRRACRAYLLLESFQAVGLINLSPAEPGQAELNQTLMLLRELAPICLLVVEIYLSNSCFWLHCIWEERGALSIFWACRVEQRRLEQTNKQTIFTFVQMDTVEIKRLELNTWMLFQKQYTSN